MLNFISFGSGSCGNCYYLYTEHDGLIIDVGVGIRSLKKNFRDYGLHFIDGINNILITHDHADHIKSVGSLSKSLNVPVWTTREVHAGIDKNYCVKCKLAHSNRRYVNRNTEFEIGEFKVFAIGVPHDSTDNVGYQISVDGVVFTLLTDVGHITDDIKSLIRKTDYLVIESNYDPQMLSSGPYPVYLQNRISQGYGHLSNIQCANVIIENYTPRLKHVWLCHLSQENNNAEIACQCVTDALNKAGIIVGNQLEVDVLRRKLPTGVFHLD